MPMALCPDMMCQNIFHQGFLWGFLGVQL